MKLLCVMASLYLALAPAMDVGALLHAMQLCHPGDTRHAEPDCHGHSHDPAPETDQPDAPDLPGDCCVAAEHFVVPITVLATVTHAAPPALTLPGTTIDAFQPPCAPLHQRVRPPPNDAPVGIVILLV